MKRIFLVVAGLTLSAQVMATGAIDLKPGTVKFVADNNLSVPDPIKDNQKTGLNWMVAPGCGAGDHTVGGLPIKCTGSKPSDVKLYVDTVSQANFYYCINHFEDPFCQ